MNENLTDQFIDALYVIEMTPALRHRAKRCLLDYAGCVLAGAVQLREKNETLLEQLGGGGNGVTVPGLGKKAPLQVAALINGISSHVLELDDGERFGMMHPGAPVISALLPLAEQGRLSGEKLLTGLVVGYEAALRIAGAVQPGLKERGYHATGICGGIGAAAACAMALDLSKEQMKDALSAAATAASGILKVIRGRSGLKPFNAGQAAMTGITAVRMAQAGFTGPDDVFGGEEGFLSVLTGTFDAERFLTRRNDLWAIERIYVKPYAACRHCHAPIEGALALREREQIRIEEIQAVHVATHRWAVHLHDHTGIQGCNSAKMSIPYSVAAALVSGKAGLAEFGPDAVRNPEILRLTEKVTVKESPELTALVPERRAACVEVVLADGRRFAERIDLPKGEPETPLTDAELLVKFTGLARYAGKTGEQAQAIADCVWNIEDHIGELWTLIA